jgi:uncharacterized protein
MSRRWKTSAGKVRLGVLSDTHGRLHEDVLRRLDGVDHIIHAGDVGETDILESLKSVATVTAVAGNSDGLYIRSMLPDEAVGEVCGIRFLVGHRRAYLLERHDDPASEGYDLVVCGHTHAAFADWHDGVLYLNPGSATAPRPGERATLVIVEVDQDGLDPHIVPLEPEEQV